MDRILDLYLHFDTLPETDGQAYKEAACNYARALSPCAAHSSREHGGALMIFDVTAKAHWMLHGADNAIYLSPRFSWKYSGGDLMRKVKVLHATCCKGNLEGQSTNKFEGTYGCALLSAFLEVDDGLR